MDWIQKVAIDKMKKVIDTTKTILAIVGGLGLFYGLYIYINAIDFVDNGRGVSFPTEFVIVLIVVWAAAILTLNQLGDLKALDFKATLNPVKLWGALFRGTPRWVMVLALSAFIFGTIHAALMSFYFEKTDIIDGKYVMYKHGQVVRELTEQEYLAQKAIELRIIVASQMIFLGMGAGILYPRETLSSIKA